MSARRRDDLPTGPVELLRVAEAARRADRSIREVLGLVDRGALPAFRDADGLIVIPAEAIRDLAR